MNKLQIACLLSTRLEYSKSNLLFEARNSFSECSILLEILQMEKADKYGFGWTEMHMSVLKNSYLSGQTWTIAISVQQDISVQNTII